MFAEYIVRSVSQDVQGYVNDKKKTGRTTKNININSYLLTLHNVSIMHGYR
jgi:hypothetical protein